MNLQNTPKKQGLILIIIAFWLLVLTVISVGTQFNLAAKLDKQAEEITQENTHRSVQTNTLAELAMRLKQLEQKSNKNEENNKESITKIQQMFLEQLKQIEERQVTEPVGMNGLKEQLQQLKDDFNKMKQKPAITPLSETKPQAQPVNRVVNNKPTTAKMPFKIMGVELRASEQFLVIVPVKNPPLSQVTLLRIGAKEGQWLLESIEGTKAIFKVNGVTRKLTIPQ